MRLPMLLLLIAFLAFVSAQELDVQPKMVGSARVLVTLNWTASLNNQQVSEFQVKTFAFKSYPSQELISETPSMVSSFETDRYGNKIRLFSLDPKKQSQSFGMVSQVRVSFPFELKQALQGESDYYLKESPYVPLTAKIRTQAKQLTQGMADDWDKLIALSLWVHNNVQYDSSYLSVSENASAVFQKRVGTCDEFSHLLIAMLRSVNIPAKFSASFVYSGKEWGAHAFVEALVDGYWVPVDPTFNEALLLDATHAKFGEGLDQQDIKEDIVIRSFNADVSKISLSRSYSVQLEDVQPFPDLFDLQLLLPEYRAGSRSLETVSVNVRNGAKKMAIPLSLNAPKEVTVIGPNAVSQDQLVLLEPFEERTVQWKVLLPALEGGYIYRFPLQVLSLGKNVTASLEASAGGQQTREESLQVSSLSTDYAEGVLQLRFLVKNSGNTPVADGNLTLDAPEFHEVRPLQVAIGEAQSFAFSVPVKDRKTWDATILLRTPKQELTQPVSVSFEQETPIPSSTQSILRSPKTSEDWQLIAFGAGAVILFLFALLALIRRPEA